MHHHLFSQLTDPSACKERMVVRQGELGKDVQSGSPRASRTCHYPEMKDWNP